MFKLVVFVILSILLMISNLKNNNFKNNIMITNKNKLYESYCMKKEY